MDQTWQFTAAQGLQQMYGGYASPLTVYNAGLISVQVTDDANGTATGFPLQPGSSIVWDAGRSLNAYVPTGVAGVALLVVLDNGGQISNPSAIASALLTAGLATAIGNAISITGAPPLNVSDAIATLQFATTGANFTSAIFDIAKYQSITYFLGDAEGAFATPLPRAVLFQWMNSAGTVVLATDTVYVVGTNGNIGGTTAVNTQGALPVRSSKLRVVYSATARVGTTAQIFLNGSYRTIDYVKYKCINGYFGAGSWVDTFGGDINANFQWMNGAKLAGAAVDFPSSRSGYCQMHLAANNVGVAAMEALLLDGQDGKRIASLQAPVAAGVTNVFTQPFMLPSIPLQLSLTAASTATSVAVSLTYLP